MANPWFQFKQFTIQQDRSAMKVTTDGCLFGAWIAENMKKESLLYNHCLDIGTGTGLLTLMLAQENEIAIDAIEIDKDAFEQAVENVTASPWSGRIQVVHADVREFESENQYDVIISNPPFYERELKSDDAKKNIAHHNEGLLFPELLSIIKKLLSPAGTFYLLLPYKRNNEIKALLSEYDLAIQQMTFVRQSVAHDYFRIMLAGKFKNAGFAETVIDEIAIKDNEDNYSQVFLSLLKKYYLHL